MTTIAKRVSGSEGSPYAPSFLDRFMYFVERLPIPYWLTYLLLFVVQSTLMHLLAWVDGWVPAYRLSPILFLYPAWQWLTLAIMTYVDSVSIQALSIFAPLLEVDEAERKELAYEFSTMPSRGVILSSLVWGVVYAILAFAFFDAFFVAYGVGTRLTAVLILEGLITFMTGGAIYYYSFRQLLLVNRTVRRVRKFDLFRLEPVYAFARVTSLVGVSWMIMLALTLLLLPTPIVEGLTLVILILQVILAAAAFVLPLWFVHRRLEAEKLRLLGNFTGRSS